jgi:hypothetical protein
VLVKAFWFISLRRRHWGPVGAIRANPCGAGKYFVGSDVIV